MTEASKQEQVLDLVKIILENFNEKSVDMDVALAVSGQLFAQICRDANLSADQFLYLCQGISEKNQWKKKEEEPHVSTKESSKS